MTTSIQNKLVLANISHQRPSQTHFIGRAALGDSVGVSAPASALKLVILPLPLRLSMIRRPSFITMALIMIISSGAAAHARSSIIISIMAVIVVG